MRVDIPKEISAFIQKQRCTEWHFSLNSIKKVLFVLQEVLLFLQ